MCSSPSLPLPSAPHCQPWGWLSSALRLSRRARAHSPGLIYFFKGGSFILVGLGGKEGWGFVKCPLRRSFYFPRFSSSSRFLRPSFLLRSPPVPVQACCVSCPYPLLPHPLSFPFFSFSSLSFLFSSFLFKILFSLLPFLWVYRVAGRRRVGR